MPTQGLTSPIFQPFRSDPQMSVVDGALHTTKDLYLSACAPTGHLHGNFLLVGESAFSDVWLDRRPHPNIVIKHYRLSRNHPINRFTLETRKKLEDAAREWKRAMNHPHVQHLRGLWDCASLPTFVATYAGLNLMDYLGTASTPCARKLTMLQDIASALLYLHSQNPPILHTNVKGSNILIDQTGKVRLTDIGVHGAISMPGQLDSCVRWKAPERILEIAPIHTKECDVWSLGMTILEVFTQKPPFLEVPYDSLIPLVVEQKLGIPARPSGLSNPLWELLLGCWSYQPSDRFALGSIVVQLRRRSEYFGFSDPCDRREPNYEVNM